MKRLNISLRSEIILNMLILMAMAIVTVGIIVVKISENSMLLMRIEGGEVLVSQLRQTLEDTFLKKGEVDIKNIQRLADSFAGHSWAKEVLVVESDNNIIAGTDLERVGKVSSDEKLLNAMTFNSPSFDLGVEETWFITSKYKDIAFYAPLFLEGKVAGGVKVLLGVDDLNDMLFRTRWLVLFFLFFDSLLLLVFGSFLLSRTVVRPLRKFVRVAGNIADGDLGQRVDYPGSNEIGQLSAAFNSMTDRLEEHVGYLERANRELTQAQQELIRSEKLASVGRLAAGVAHEVGNPLGAILGYTDMLQKGVGDEAVRSDYLRRIEREIRAIDVTIRELLDYSRSSKAEIKVVDVKAVVKEAVSLLSHQEGFGQIEIRLDMEDEATEVMANDHQLQQVLVNIMLNALDAMPDGGTLELEIKKCTLGKDISGIMPRRKSDEEGGAMGFIERVDKRFGKEVVRIDIKDSGSGIKEEDLGRIFDPFFTTRETGKGTGLGLSVSQGIIETFDGNIEVSSEVGKGSTFSIILPATDNTCKGDVS